jgi:hypothetical protein
MATHWLRSSLIPFGPHANCTLDICPLEWSILRYRPSISANVGLIAIFGVLIFAHAVQGYEYRTPGHALAIVVGCVLQIVGYAGRIVLHGNPFHFAVFVLQTSELAIRPSTEHMLTYYTVCITIAPLFYCAAIYVLLAQLCVYPRSPQP